MRSGISCCCLGFGWRKMSGCFVNVIQTPSKHLLDYVRFQREKNNRVWMLRILGFEHSFKLFIFLLLLVFISASYLAGDSWLVEFLWHNTVIVFLNLFDNFLWEELGDSVGVQEGINTVSFGKRMETFDENILVSDWSVWSFYCFGREEEKFSGDNPIGRDSWRIDVVGWHSFIDFSFRHGECLASSFSILVGVVVREFRFEPTEISERLSFCVHRDSNKLCLGERFEVRAGRWVEVVKRFRTAFVFGNRIRRIIVFLAYLDCVHLFRWHSIEESLICFFLGFGFFFCELPRSFIIWVYGAHEFFWIDGFVFVRVQRVVVFIFVLGIWGAVVIIGRGIVKRDIGCWFEGSEYLDFVHLERRWHNSGGESDIEANIHRDSNTAPDNLRHSKPVLRSHYQYPFCIISRETEVKNFWFFCRHMYKKYIKLYVCKAWCAYTHTVLYRTHTQKQEIVENNVIVKASV